GDPSDKAHVSQEPDESPNYLSLDREQVQNAWINEFLAPFQGIKNVREAHGNRAAAELAVQICAEYPEPSKNADESTSPQTQTAGPLENAKKENVGQSSPVKATYKYPYFAHLAMCMEGNPAPVQPPLGWVLSKATQDAFEALLSQCGNKDELDQLEIAIGKQE